MRKSHSDASTGTLGKAMPIFNVSNLDASLAYYVDVLGFTTDWIEPTGVASVSRDRCCLFLCEGDQGVPGAWIWIGVRDVEALHSELRANGARVRHPPTNYPWACEMQIEDPDGNVLRMGSDPQPAEPVGEWLDMRGVRWKLTSSGHWIRAER